MTIQLLPKAWARRGCGTRTTYALSVPANTTWSKAGAGAEASSDVMVVVSDSSPLLSSPPPLPCVCVCVEWV